MGKRIIYAARFSRELDGQLRWIAAERPDSARRMATRVRAAISLLADNPELGRPGRLDGTRELVVPRTPYLACYRIVGDSVEMLLFRHGRRQWPDRL